jgi:hypothetical protein
LNPRFSKCPQVAITTKNAGVLIAGAGPNPEKEDILTTLE